VNDREFKKHLVALRLERERKEAQAANAAVKKPKAREHIILLLVDRLPDPFGDDRRILVQSEQHRPLEALWPSDDHPHSPTKCVGSNPALVLLFDVPASGLDSRFNPLAACGRDSLAVEDYQRHAKGDYEPFWLTIPPYRSTLYLFGGTSNDGIGPWAWFLNQWTEGLLATVIRPKS
jgi:hypothetical protein